MELLQIIESAKEETFITEFETILTSEEERKHFSQFVGINISFFEESKTQKKVQTLEAFRWTSAGLPNLSRTKIKRQEPKKDSNSKNHLAKCKFP